VPSQVAPPSGVHPRPSANGEAGGQEESQLITQQPDRPKEGEEDINSSLGPISLVGTKTKSKNINLAIQIHKSIEEITYFGWRYPKLYNVFWTSKSE